jgi:formamidopyrimidine-DNA glycosylase
VARVGKNLLLTFAGRQRVGAWSHLGMTGKWLLREDDAPAPRFSRLRLRLDDGHALHYADQRLFGRFVVVPGARFRELPELAALGADPLDDGIDAERLAARLSTAKRPIKVALLDQSLVPGVGNIQASEALHRARIDPRRPAASLAHPEVGRLAVAVIDSMRDAIARMEEEPGDVTYVEEPGAANPFRVYRHAGELCPRCRRARIERVVLGGRSTYFCPRCQK